MPHNIFEDTLGVMNSRIETEIRTRGIPGEMERRKNGHKEPDGQGEL